MDRSLEFFLNLSFLIFRMEIIKTTFHGCCENQIFADTLECFVDSKVLYKGEFFFFFNSLTVNLAV